MITAPSRRRETAALMAADARWWGGQVGRPGARCRASTAIGSATPASAPHSQPGSQPHGPWISVSASPVPPSARPASRPTRWLPRHALVSIPASSSSPTASTISGRSSGRGVETSSVAPGNSARQAMVSTPRSELFRTSTAVPAARSTASIDVDPAVPPLCHTEVP